MTTERDEIVLRGRKDITQAAIEEIKLYSSESSCAGTWQTTGDGCERPCGGNGLVLEQYERLRITMNEGQEPIETIRPKKWAVCPCIEQKRRAERRAKILTAFGLKGMIDKDIVPELNQAPVIERFRNSEKSFFVFGANGGGKTYLAAQCALIPSKHAQTILTSDEIASDIRAKAFENESPQYEGTLYIDDFDKVHVTDSLKAKVWYLIDCADKEKTRLFITTNFTPKAFAERFSGGSEDALSMIRRLTGQRFELVEL